MSLNVYVSYSASPWELAHVFALANEGLGQGLNVFIPDRTWRPPIPPDYVLTELSRADLVVLFATVGGNQLDWVNAEIKNMSRSQPTIGIVELGVQLDNIPSGNIIWLDRRNSTESIRLTLERLRGFNISRQMGNLLAGFLVSSLALLLLRGFTKRG